MPLIKPFRGLRPATAFVNDVIAPPYDVLNSEEARQYAEGNPYSFLHVSKPEIDLPTDTDPYSAAVYQKGAENFAALRQQKILLQDEKPCYYAYRMQMGNHQQTGIVAAASVAAYVKGNIRKHELTFPKKETDRVKNIEALNAQTGPVILTYREHSAVKELLANLTQQAATYEVSNAEGVIHSLWIIDQAADIAAINDAFANIERIYIADGHHRSAAASRVAEQCNKANAESERNYFLSVLFPDTELQILPYNRIVKDLNGLSKAEFLDKLSEHFTYEVKSTAVEPQQHGEYGMYLDGQWYCLRLNADKAKPINAIDRLDVSLLNQYLLDPILGIGNPRTDERINFVGGIRGTDELAKRVDSDEMTVAFSLFATGVDELLTIADENGIMPPKSTWFEPKLVDGLISHILD